jgi:hypothetical protein
MRGHMNVKYATSVTLPKSVVVLPGRYSVKQVMFRLYRFSNPDLPFSTKVILHELS